MRAILSLVFALSLAVSLPVYADSSSGDLRQLLTPEHFDADAAIAALEASDMSSRNKISGKAMIDSARNTPKHQLDVALEQIRVVLGLE